jgi:hypothetical protein
MATKRKFTTNYLWFPYRTKEYLLLLAAIDHALTNGYTLIEIKRILAMEKARRLYEVLCREDLIFPLKTGRPPALPCELPQKFESALKENDIGFYQWCNGMRPNLDPSRAAKSLNSGDYISYPEAHICFFRDFPFVYKSLYETVLVLADEPIEALDGRIAVLITGDEVAHRVTAINQSDPTMLVEADTAIKVLELYYSLHRTVRATQRLQTLPDRRLGGAV